MAAAELCLLAMCLAYAVAARHQPHTLFTANVTTANMAADPNGGYFQMFGTSKVSGISTVLTFKKTVILLDRTDVVNTKDHLPNGQLAFGEEYDYKKNYFRPLDVLTNTFCSTGQIGADGAFYSLGGTTNDPNYQIVNGAASVRKFVPCDGGPGATCGFSIAGGMSSRRWYPTSQILPDGRIFIIGGGNLVGNLAINNGDANNPTYEFWPGGGNNKVGILEDQENIPYNLYPFVHLLPSGNLFIFAGQLSIVLDYNGNKVVKNLPRMQAPGEGNVYRSYPVTGTSALFPLDPAKGYAAGVLICGGNSKGATILSLKGNDCPGCYIGASRSCGVIYPDSGNPQWQWENMPGPRVMPDAVLLLDDTIVIMNGAEQGFQGLSQQYASKAVTQPVLYDTRKPAGQRFSKVNADAGIPRMYHSSALLMPDGSVLVSGSNPNTGATGNGPYPTEYRTQLFFPHYAAGGVSRNVLTNTPGAINMNGDFQVTFTTTIATPAGMKDTDRFRVVIANPGFSTHSSRHGMRNVFLQVTDAKVNGAAGVQNASSAADPVFGTATVTSGGRSLKEVVPLGTADAKEADQKPQHTEYLGGRANGHGGHPAGKGHHKTYAAPADNKGKDGGDEKKEADTHNKPAAPAGAFSVTLNVKGPPSGNIAPSGYYWLHVLDQGTEAGGGFWVPTVEGAVVKVNR